MIRRYGEPVKSGVRYRLRPGAYALLMRNGRALVTFQADPNPEIQLPGGGIDPGESPIQALHREVFEETGWTIAAPRCVGCYRRFTYMPDYDLWAEKICHIFLARPARHLGPPTEPGHTALWLEPQDLPTLLESPGDRAFAARLLGLG